MPYPTQIDRVQLVAAAQQLVENEGVEALSLHKVATVLGVKAPSLYRYVSNKAELLRAINEATVQQLFAAMHEQAAPATAPAAQLLAMLHTFRHFAHRHPHTYMLLFTAQAATGRPDEGWLVELVLPLQRLMAQVSGEAQSLAALRGALALAHGFIMLELNGQLQRGGDLGADYETALVAYLRGIQQ